MRILFILITIFFSTLVAAGIGLAETMEDYCHEEKMALSHMVALTCCCDKDMRGSDTEISYDSLTGSGCCIPQTCTNSLVSNEVAPCSTLSASDAQNIERVLLIYQPEPLSLVIKVRLLLPPLRPPPGPLFTQHCSFLI